MPNSSQHRLTKRVCPGCKKEKMYPARNEACSFRCGRKLEAERRAGFAAKTAEGFTVNGDAATAVRVTPERVRTLAQLLKLCEVDGAEWEVERWQCNKWDMASVPRSVRGSGADSWTRPSTAPVVTELYQVKAWFKRKVSVIAARREIEELKEQAKRAISPKFATIKRRRESGYMLEVSIPDLHLGKLAWGKETGWANYDTKLAEQVFEDALAALIERTSAYRFDQVVFVVGNDLLNSDNRESTTAAGTPQDTDGRFQKSFSAARLLITRAIERLRTIAPVLVTVVPGNHDTLSTWCLGDSLEARFHACPDVTVDNAPTLRKYHRFGRVMLMFTHGNRGRLADYPLVMAAEQPKMFGETAHREAHTGDKHHFKLEDYHGVRVRISPALCPPDAWHAENHYVGASRSAEAFVWHKDEGLVATAIYTVPGYPMEAR
jgi:hypothetical protein